MKENKTVSLNIRISEKTKQALAKLAEADQRTISDYVRLQLEKLTKGK